MDELVEGVLSVGTRLPPHDGTRGVVHTSPSTGHALAVGLHVALNTPTCGSHACHMQRLKAYSPAGSKRQSDGDTAKEEKHYDENIIVVVVVAAAAAAAAVAVVVVVYLIVRQKGMALGPKEVIVEDTKYGHDRWHLQKPRRSLKNTHTHTHTLHSRSSPVE